MPAAHPFSVVNKGTQPVVVFSTVDKDVSNPPSTSFDDYMAVYAQLGTVAQGQTGHFSTDLSIGRIVIARAADQFPLTLGVLDNTQGAGGQTITTNPTDEALTQKAFDLYKFVCSKPFAPLSLQFSDIMTKTADPAGLDAAIATFLNNNGYPGVTLGAYAMVGYWATSRLFAFPGTYYVYEPQSDRGTSKFILPTVPIGTIAGRQRNSRLYARQSLDAHDPDSGAESSDFPECDAIVGHVAHRGGA